MSNAAPDLAQDLPEELRVLLLPGADRELLLPGGAVAEIVRPDDLAEARPAGPMGGSPGWAGGGSRCPWYAYRR